jgi:hypothetical protein
MLHYQPLCLGSSFAFLYPTRMEVGVVVSEESDSGGDVEVCHRPAKAHKAQHDPDTICVAVVADKTMPVARGVSKECRRKLASLPGMRCMSPVAIIGVVELRWILTPVNSPVCEHLQLLHGLTGKPGSTHFIDYEIVRSAFLDEPIRFNSGVPPPSVMHLIAGHTVGGQLRVVDKIAQAVILGATFLSSLPFHHIRTKDHTLPWVGKKRGFHQHAACGTPVRFACITTFEALAIY